MKINAIQCLSCKDKVFSRARHDFRWCTCMKCAIDGGFDYMKISGDKFEIVELDIDATKKELYDDWNNAIDKYGVVRDE